MTVAPRLPAFDNSKPLFVFDGHCVLCSRGVSFLMRHDTSARVRFASSQSPLGEALHAHFNVHFDESYLLIDQDRAYTKTDGYLQLCRILGGPWRLFLLGQIVPRRLRDWAYDIVARNRYRWFGTSAQCALLSPEQREALLARVVA
jgi:predicted DCC family thiol-disulfide oxidoreductase YuxK